MGDTAKELSILTCKSRGSKRMVPVAWACRNPEVELWVLEQEFGAAFCYFCEADAKLVWKPYKPAE
jgi:hypothetical protein